jgi:DNA-binding transcriptional ArsR family regulator
VPAGKLSITGPSGTGFSPLVRTFPPAFLENFSQEEAIAFIQKKLSQAKTEIDNQIFDKIYETTEGHPFVLTAYMETTYSKLTNGDNKLTAAHFNAADVEFVGRTLAPFFARFYDQTGRTSRKILSEMAITPKGEITLSDLSRILAMDMNELSPHLAKLVQDGAIIRIDRGKYKLFHHLLGGYIRYKQEKHI